MYVQGGSERPGSVRDQARQRRLAEAQAHEERKSRHEQRKFTRERYLAGHDDAPALLDGGGGGGGVSFGMMSGVSGGSSGSFAEHPWPPVEKRVRVVAKRVGGKTVFEEVEEATA
jgi:hypothetical protein